MNKKENVEKTFTDPQTGKFASGNPGGGRPTGQRNYATLYRLALERIAKAQDKTPEEIEEILNATGLKKALKGDYAFYRDVQDRLHGKPMQHTDVTSGGEKIVFIPSEIAEKNAINTSPERNS